MSIGHHGRGQGGDGTRFARTTFSKPTFEKAARTLVETGGGAFSDTVGMAVHDVGRYAGEPLKPGQVFSVDPQLWVGDEKLGNSAVRRHGRRHRDGGRKLHRLPAIRARRHGKARSREGRRSESAANPGVGDSAKVAYGYPFCTHQLREQSHGPPPARTFPGRCRRADVYGAAERVCRTQPAVSQSIKKLEEEVGAPLFARDVHEVSLTEAGRVLADYARRMVHLRDEALRQVTELKSLKAGTLAIAAHESAAVYLLPAPLRGYLQKFPDIKVGIYRSRLNEIPRQVMDWEVDVGFVKDEPAFHELQWVDVHSDEMVCIVSPRHSLASKTDVRIRDRGSEQFVLHHLCSTTAETILRLFDQNGKRCRIFAELWSFENIKSFVQEEVGMAIVPGITVRQELRDGTLVRVPLRELSVPRRTLMIYREQGYVSDTARELIKIVRAFNWDQGFRTSRACGNRSPPWSRRNSGTGSAAMRCGSATSA